MEIVKHIASIPLFEDLPKEQQEDLAMIVVDQVFKRGQTIFTEGDDATGFYVGVTGRVKIYKLSFEGKEQILHIFGPGEPFGEVPVFTGQNFPANAQAMDESRIFFFPRESFIELIKNNPSIALNMLAVYQPSIQLPCTDIDNPQGERTALLSFGRTPIVPS